jgi:NAD(P)-dependent dehydrogenase (short-subunit alcohol dehydrogenase family)
METVLITGVSSSIGESIAVKLSSKYKIILSGRNFEYLKEVNNKLHGRDHKLWVCDLLFDSISDSLETFLIDNNLKVNHFLHLGGNFSTSPLRLVKKNDITNSFQINVFSAIEIISLLSKKLYRNEMKNLIFFSSISTKKGFPGYAIYSSAKSALMGLTKTLSIELSPTKVNCIILGSVLSKKTHELIANNEEKINAQIPLGIAQSDVLDNWVEFLLQSNSWMTGQEIIIDGGATVL